MTDQTLLDCINVMMQVATFNQKLAGGNIRAMVLVYASCNSNDVNPSPVGKAKLS